MEARKRCKACGGDFPLSGFYANRNGRCGRHSLCRACMDAKKQRSLAKFRSMGDARLPESKVCSMCRQAMDPSAFSRHATSGDGLRTYCRECDRIVRRAIKYELPRERVVEMLRQTQCEACGKDLPTDADKHTDHRHSDGAVRGILCNECNTTLGLCNENPAVLQGICDYIARTANVDYRKQPYAVTSMGVSGTLNPIDSPTPEADGTQCPTISPQKLSSP